MKASSFNGRKDLRQGVRRPGNSRRQQRTAGRPVAIRSILVPTDFSRFSEKALDYAAAFARQCGARITLVHVIEPIATPDFAVSFPIALQTEKAQEFCKGVLDQIGQKHDLTELLEGKLICFGRPFSKIVEAARTLKTDLIVIATHGYTGLKRTFLGSTAEAVVRHAPCPVLVVRSAERDFAVSRNRTKSVSERS